MASVGTAEPGLVLIATGQGKSPNFVPIGKFSGLTNSSVVLAGGNNPFTVVTPGSNGQVLTISGGVPAWSTPATSVLTINGDTGSITGSTVTIFANNATLNAGQSVSFVNSGTVSTFNVTDALNNTVIGKNAGKLSQTYSNTTYFGYLCGKATTTGSSNCGFGMNALGSFTTGSSSLGSNVAVGLNSLTYLVTGINNCCIGSLSGSAYTTSETGNILISNIGTLSESNTIRIGSQGSSTSQQNRCFVAGIVGVTASNPVLTTINSSTGQLGVQALTQYSLLSGGATNALNQIAASATVGAILQSSGAAAQPVYSTASYPATSGGSGNVLTSDGTNWTSAAPAASAASLITTFTSNGSWTVNSKTKSARILAWAGGGGGGSGRCGASGTAGGGAGGGTGNFVDLIFNISVLGSSPYTVTVGTGGTGGTSINATTTNGNPGNPGNITSVGSLIVSAGGLGGAGGINGNAAGGGAGFIAFNGTALAGNAGANGSNTLGGNGSIILYSYAGGGGGGSGYTAATARAGGNGSNIANTSFTTIVTGGLGGANDGSTAGNGNAPVNQSMYIGATGGGGGGHNGTVTAGAGGNGAQPGGGGGGGAGNLSLNPSGAGGNGGNGQVIIIEYF